MYNWFTSLKNQKLAPQTWPKLMVVRRSFVFEVVPLSGTCQFSVGVLLWHFFSHRIARRKWGRYLAPSFIVYFGSHCLWHSDEHVLAWCAWEWNESTCTYRSPEYTIDLCDPINRYRSQRVITNILHGSSSAMGLRKQGMAVSNLLARFCFPHLSWSETMTQWHDVWQGWSLGKW